AAAYAVRRMPGVDGRIRRRYTGGDRGESVWYDPQICAGRAAARGVQAVTRTAVQFGAGNIGRGFIAQLFCESGLDVVFVDVEPRLLEELNRRHEYTIRIVGPGADDVPITGVRGIDGRD